MEILFRDMRGYIRDPVWWAVGGVMTVLMAWVLTATSDHWYPFEVYIVPPKLESPMPAAPGDAVVIRWHTRINRECFATYSRRLERADGLTYQLGSHRGSYVTPSEDANGKVFRTTFHVPSDVLPGRYQYIVTTDIQCWPWTHHEQESPPVAVEVR